MFEKLSVVIPWDPRTEDSYRLRSFDLIQAHVTQSLPEAELVLGSDESEPFSRSKARNNGVLNSSGDVVLLLDADTFIPAESVREALELSDGWVIPYQTYYNLSRPRTDKVLSNFDLVKEEPQMFGEDYEHKILSWAGALLVSRELFEVVGGYDERFIGWGWEDVAFRVKADAIAGQHQRCGSFVSHLWHHRPPEIQFFNTHEQANARLFDIEYRQRYNWKDERP